MARMGVLLLALMAPQMAPTVAARKNAYFWAVRRGRTRVSRIMAARYADLAPSRMTVTYAAGTGIAILLRMARACLKEVVFNTDLADSALGLHGRGTKRTT